MRNALSVVRGAAYASLAAPSSTYSTVRDTEFQIQMATKREHRMRQTTDRDGVDGPWTRAMDAAERDNALLESAMTDADREYWARIARAEQRQAERVAQDAKVHADLIRDEWLAGKASLEDIAKAEAEAHEAARRAGWVVL